MRTVVYDNFTYEPLTVISVPGEYLLEIERGERPPILQFATEPRIPPTWEVSARPEPDLKLGIVTLRFEPIMKGRHRLMWLCTAEDGETALLLRSVFLAGQNYRVAQREQEAFARGLILAFGGR